MNWSREELKDMSELEYREFSQMRFDEICEHCKACKDSYVSKPYLWKIVAGWCIAAFIFACKVFGGRDA